MEALFRERPSKVNDGPYAGAVFATLHSPPWASGINRTTWKMADFRVTTKGDVQVEN